MTNAAYTATACRIAGIDRQKLTDAIASGEYNFAPPTTAGRARRFELPDLITLHTYARLTEDGWPTRLASRFASQLKQILDHEPEAEFVRLIQPIMGSPFASTDPVIDPSVTHISGLPIRYHFAFDLRNTRGLIEAMLDEENRTAGWPDE